MKRLPTGLRALCSAALLLGALAGPLPGAAQQPQLSEPVLRRLIKTVELAETEPESALEELARMLRRVRSDSPAFQAILQERISLLLRQKQVAAARTELATALADRPATWAPTLRLLYAQVLLLDDDTTLALEQLEIWRRQFAQPPPTGLFLQAYALVQRDRYAEAIEALELALEIDQALDRPQWVELLAYAYTRAGEPQRAISLLEGVIARYPDRTRWWRQLASNHLLREEVERGAAAFSIAALLERPEYEDARRLARLYAYAGMPAEGAERLAAALERSGAAASFEDRMLLGELWMLARETDRALQAFAEAAALDTTGEAQLMAAQLHLQREAYAPARDALRQAVSAYGDEVPARLWYLLAIVEINLEDLGRAREALAALAAEPSYDDRRQRLEAYVTARARQAD